MIPNLITTRLHTRSSRTQRRAVPSPTPPLTATQRVLPKEAPRTIKRSAQGAKQFIEAILYGSARHTISRVEMQRETFKRRHDALSLQQAYCEDLLDLSPSRRHEREWPSDEPVIRFDKQAYDRISSWIRPDRKDSSILWLMGGIKSALTTSGQVLPAGALPAEVWEEEVPVTLANLAYQHVMSTNKVRYQERLPADASPQQIEALRVQKRQELEARQSGGSPLTSFTVRPPMEDKLEAWGESGSRIELQRQSAKLIGPFRLAWMIREFANAPGIDEPVDFAWREDRGCFPDPECAGVRRMERLLADIGIDPDGRWTRREKAVFYVLVADEHLLIGVPPAGSAAIVESRKSE